MFKKMVNFNRVYRKYQLQQVKRAERMHTRIILLSFLMFNWAAGAAEIPTKNKIITNSQSYYLSDLRRRVFHHRQSWGNIGYDQGVCRDVKNTPKLVIAGKEYAKGLGVHANATTKVGLNKEFDFFESDIGASKNKGTVVFEVLADGEIIYKSEIMTTATSPIHIKLPVKNVSVLTLIVNDAGNGYAHDSAAWGNAMLTATKGTDIVGDIENMDIAKFARVVDSNPSRKNGTEATRLEEFPAEDIFPEEPIKQNPQGYYDVPIHGEQGCIGLQWAERRVLKTLSLKFSKAVTFATDEVMVEYWSSEGRVDGSPNWASIGQTLWQGRWEPLPGTLNINGNLLQFSITSNKVPEFADGSGTQKVRWIFPASGAMVVEELRAMSSCGIGSKNTELYMQIEPSLPETGQIVMYNGYIIDDKGNNLTTRNWDLSKALTLKIKYTALPEQNDRTLLRFSLPQGKFAVAVEDVIRTHHIYVKDYRFYITDQPQEYPLAQYLRNIAGKETSLEKVRRMPDQTFSQAMDRLFRKTKDNDPILLSLACDNNKFQVNRDGEIIVVDPNIVVNPNYSKPKQNLFRVVPVFGFQEEKVSVQRTLTDGWLPIPVTIVRQGNLKYRQRTFVAGYQKHDKQEKFSWYNEKPLCVAEYEIQNPETQAVNAQMTLKFQKYLNRGKDRDWDQNFTCPLNSCPDGLVFVDGNKLLAYLQFTSSSTLKTEIKKGEFVLSGLVPAKTNIRLRLFIPAWNMKPSEYKIFAGSENLQQKTKKYWQAIMSSGMQIDIPDNFLENIIKASQVHCFLAARNSNNGDFVEPWVGSMYYGPLDTEAQAVIMGMDKLGHKDFVRRCLDYYLSRYNQQGMLANGYTIIGTGQNLWALGNHYLNTRDKAWLKKSAPVLEKVCRWIISQRDKTKRLGPNGQKMPEYGLVPPGVLADWNRYAYYFYGQGYYYAGLNLVSQAFGDINTQLSKELSNEAQDFKNEILRAFNWNQARMPVRPLSNGMWVPAYPSSLYCFGLTRYFYKGLSAIGHDVEVGSNHLILQGIISPESPDARYMTNYMEDVWYLRPDLLINYPAETMKGDWFNFGGFSKLQQYYTRTPDIYAKMDDVKPFIRSYFNSIPPTLSSETLAFWEHFMPGCWNKTHETGWFLVQTHDMFVYEKGNELWLAPFVTNNWLKDGMKISIKNAPTKFGPVSYEVTSRINHNMIEATIHTPQRSTARVIILRLRHPQEKRFKKVTVNGENWNNFNVDKELIYINSSQKTLSVVAYYQ